MDHLEMFQVQQATVTATSHSGPLPPPEQLQQYDQALPGTADRIISMAEGEAAHRRQIETKLFDLHAEDRRKHRMIEARGQTFALIITLVVVIGGMIVIGLGHALAGSLLSGGTICALATLFIYGRESQKRDREADQPQRKGTAGDNKQLPPAGD